MSTPGTQRYSRIMLTLMNGGTKITRRLVEKRVKDLSKNGEEDTIDEFLLKNEAVILQQKLGKKKENVFFPPSGHTNLDIWDLCMFCFILEKTCDLSNVTNMRIKKLLKIRNKLCHLNDPTLETMKFDEYTDDLKVSFENCLKEINDEKFTEEMNALVQSLATDPLSIDDAFKAIHTLYRSEWTQREVLEKIGNCQDLTNGKLDALMEKIEKLESRRPSGASVDIPGIGIAIEVENCSAEEEKEMLDTLEKYFNEAIEQKVSSHEEDLPNYVLHTVRESVKQVFRDFLMRGRRITIVKQKCLLLTIKCTSVKNFLEMIHDYRTGDLSLQLSGIETAIKNFPGCSNVQLANLIFKEEFMEVMDDLVSKLCKRVQQTENTAVQTSSNAENSIRVTLKFPTISERENVQNRFETKMFVDEMNSIESELRRMLNVERMSLTDKLVANDDAVSDFAQQNDTSVVDEIVSAEEETQTKQSKRKAALWEEEDLSTSTLRRDSQLIFDKSTHIIKSHVAKAIGKETQISIDDNKGDRQIIKQLLNNCFDDIEKFVQRLQQTADAYKELEGRRLERGGKGKQKSAGDEKLMMRARPLPAEDFIDIFQKFKFAFNLLAHIHDPNAPELVHFLFTPLSLIYEASRDSIHGGRDLSSEAVAPLLLYDAKQLLLNCLTSNEFKLWQTLGHPWTLVKDEWSGKVPSYNPRFYNGWQPSPQLVNKVNKQDKIRDVQIEETIDVYKCDPCDWESLASSYCPECEEFLCEECVKSHKKMNATKKHEILAAEMGKDHKTMGDENKKNVPGTPYAVEVFPDSVLLAWDRPTKFEDKSCYQISFKDISSNHRWRSYHEEIYEASTKITGLKSNTTYVFRVRVIYRNGEESPFSLESEEIRTAASLAKKMLRTSIQVTSGNSPNKYALPIKENIDARNEKAKTRKFEVGKPPTKKYVESKTIMLVGATGTGKSTFVDGIINYVLGVTWEDPFRYTIIDLEAEEKGRIQNQALSQTEWITCYTINPESGSRLSYQLTIIDTPGFGDTRGLKRDEEIFGQIRQLFSDTGPRGVSCIDAVCFLIKAPDARLTAIQSYIFLSIMALFGKDIEKNICSIISFADGNDPPVLAALKESELPFGKHFTFNNSVLFATNSGMESQGLSPMFWNIGLTSFCAFFKHLGQMRTKSLQLTKDVLLERCRLEAIVRTLKGNLEAGLQMVEVLKSERNVLKQHKTAMEANKNFEVEVSEPTVIKTLIPGRVHNTKCDNCYVKCHERCIYEDNEEKRKCWVMDGNGKCRICPDHCDWTAHKNDAFTYTNGVKKVKKTLNELKEKYTDARGKAKSHEEMVDKNAAELQELTNNIEDMMLHAKFCNEKLQEIALKPARLTMTEHIDLMIEHEKLTRREGYLMRIQVLNEFRKDAEVHKEVEVFKRVAEVELGESYSEKKKETRPMDSKSVIRRAAQWLMKYISGFSI